MTRRPLTVELPEDRLECYQQSASEAGISLTSWLIAAADAKLPAKTRKGLAPLRGRGRPKAKE